MAQTDKLASIGQLSAGIAHELNNPINFVRGNVSPLQRDLDMIISLIEQYDDLIKANNLEKVFDRIRENIPKRRGEPYETIVNRSLLETIHRSLATQLNAIFVLIALLLFGGATMKQFVAVLLVGLLSGTYSSIFNAVPLLVVWETGKLRGTAQKVKAKAAA